MVKIFLETQNDKTPEYWFFYTLLTRAGVSANDFEIIRVAGKDKLFYEATKNILAINTIEGGINLVIFDADSNENKGGFAKRSEAILKKRDELGLSFDLFLMPNNKDDGDFETMIETIARKDLHKVFFDCYNDYEKCIEGSKDSDGNQKYFAPNLKGKLHTYITSMRMSNTQRNKVRGGNWQFDNPEYWDINDLSLEPLREFVLKYFNK